MPNPYEGDPRCKRLYEDFSLLTDDCIRLITLDQGQFDDYLRCTLLDYYPEVEYEALSYTWELDGLPSMFDLMAVGKIAAEKDSNPTDSTKSRNQSSSAVEHTIWVNGQIIPVMPNLANALRYIRLPDEDRTLWIDYLCINQNSIDDRNQQVSRMADIYARAAGVIVWLGLEESNDKPAYHELEHMAQGWHFDEMYPNKTPGEIRQALEPIAKLMERPWWARCWVVQEVALAVKVTVMAGHTETDWRTFVRARDTYQKHVSCCEHILWDTNFTFNDEGLGVILNAVPDLSGPMHASLQAALRFCLGRTASDPRDRIFSMLGLLGRLPEYAIRRNLPPPITNEQVTKVKPDYNVPWQEVYRLATLDCMHFSDNLSILVQSGNFLADPSLPSWASDFRFSHHGGRFLSSIWSADMRGASNLSMCSPRKLRLVGIPLDEIGQVGPSLRAYKNALSQESIVATHTAMQAWEKMYAEAKIRMTQYKTLTNRENAFWQTIRVGWDVVNGRRLHSKDRRTYDKWREWVQRRAGRTRSRWKLINDRADEDVRKYQNTIARETTSFFVTRSGYFGMAYPSAEPGDWTVMLTGARTLLILRMLDEECETCGQSCFNVVGCAYVHGVMDGEILQECFRGEYVTTGFCLK